MRFNLQSYTGSHWSNNGVLQGPMFTSVDEGTESSDKFLHIIGNGMQLIHHDEVCK